MITLRFDKPSLTRPDNHPLAHLSMNPSIKHFLKQLPLTTLADLQAVSAITQVKKPETFVPGSMTSKAMQKTLARVKVSNNASTPITGLKQISSKMLDKLVASYVNSRSKLRIHDSNPIVADALLKLELIEKGSKKLTGSRNINLTTSPQALRLYQLVATEVKRLRFLKNYQ